MQVILRAGRIARAASASLVLVMAGACSQAGQLGDILGSVLGGGGSQVAGTVRGVDTRSQQISLQQSNGQTVALAFDNQTKVVYQNRNYSVTSLENGDQVTASVQQLQNGGYYTDSVQVTQPSATSGTSGTSTSETVQSLRGTVGQVDRTNGLFTVSTGNNVVLTVSLPYNTSSADRTRFQNLRVGDVVQFYGVYITNTRVELRQFN
jgi:hypothetical protein